MVKFLAILIILISFGCKQQCHTDSAAHSKSENHSPLYKKVMEVHDAVMPEMANIHKLKKELKKLELTENRVIVLKKIKELDDADEAMMSWMAGFKVSENSTNQDAYLMAEKAKIQAVSDEMYSIIKSSEKLIDSLQSSNQIK